MKTYTSAILFGILAIVSGCNSDDCDTSFSCETVAPTYGTLTVSVTPNDQNPLVPIAVYIGDIEDSSLYFVDTIFQSTEYYVDLDVTYSGSATYRDGSKTIIAIDGDRVRLKEEQNCELTCYTVKNGFLQLGLKP
jgi:hypothetical protein